MSWFRFAAGFVKGFVENYFSPEPAGGVSSYCDHDFHARMRRLLAAAGLTIDRASDEAVGCTISSHGSEFFFVLLDKGSQIIIRGHSDYSFRPGGVPRAVRRAMEMLNSREDRFSYDVTDLDDRSLCCVTTMVSSHSLTPASFQMVVTKLGHALLAMKCTLAREGFI